ncbi:HlyD family type I secretion periplasmic adaptor subunit [Bradyrhizobium sp. WSM 1738]|uniref:HlyD family type I secretion periplasmic adaptor subunit n=1 Tax=Bradyrhizobium hereditatis TaxID=2821405 RepID=UPI001CE2B59C|nr:HlyD family type I secretion periplasmic adaptor subunit [Bradyrhizobium hereditatis]MCA6116507.1 HlyD family type I secretion periplasmic adaptor subunit [Bradyrhizobium hereditatis]
MTGDTSEFDVRPSIRRHIVFGLAAVMLVAGGIGGWAATTDISGALIAAGSVVVESNAKKVQHPTGGVVGEIAVTNGKTVNAGDLLLRLDETMTRANLQIVSRTLDEMTARRARLRAERDGAREVAWPSEFRGRRDEPAIIEVMADEERLFQLRNTTRLGQKRQLGERIAQLTQEAAGIAAQQTAKSQEILLIERELKGVRELWEKNLIQLNRLTTLEREAARLDGDRAQLMAAEAQGRGKIAEIELQITQIDRELASEVGRELREIDGKANEYAERKVAAEDQLRRTDIRAPISGIVHELNVHTIGGVISAGEQLMLIVPGSDRLTVEARVAPQDIDQVKIGQAAGLRFSAFNQRTTPEISGTVSRVSADVTTEQRTGMTYYTARIAIEPHEIARLGDVKLLPGMPVEAFIKTGDRTVGSYLTKPLFDQVARAFRER